VRYEPWRVVVELDGREAHPAESWFRDMDRDNRAAFAGEQALRYGWREVVNDPCHIASQVGSVLTHGGWPGLPRPCGVDCAVLRSRQK
jgi:very-short-patch-repair endonuclease